jgi:uncharacterized protein (TIGR03663 family)
LAGPAHSRRLFPFLAGLLLAGAGCLRYTQIDRRTLHADEGVQAYQTWQLMRGEGYTYDPADKHGPWLYYAAAGLAQISGWSPASLTPARLRTVPLLAGLGTLTLLLGAATRLGRSPALLGAALLAVAPLAIIYDTYYVQEAWFCFFSWALFFAALRLREQPSLTGALLLGTLAGLMQATKETSVLHFAALGVALLVVRPMPKTRTPDLGGTRPPDGFSPERVATTRPAAGFHLVAALLAAAFVYVLFYSAGFTRWAGVPDGLRTYFTYAARAAGSAHDQPWSYYLTLLWPHPRDGVRWGEPLLLAAALAGVVFAFSPRANPTQRAVAVFTLTLLLLYSLIPYKTPWLLLTPYVGLALLAGLGATGSGHGLPANIARYAPGLLGLVLVAEAGWRDLSALGRYANDERNPYVYQPTAPDLTRLVAALPIGSKIAVVSPDHAWPLPWYLRDHPTVGYFAATPANLAAYEVVLLDSRLPAPPPAAATAYGLRPNVLLWRTTR